jgi:hypothetical protein
MSIYQFALTFSSIFLYINFYIFIAFINIYFYNKLIHPATNQMLKLIIIVIISYEQ